MKNVNFNQEIQDRIIEFIRQQNLRADDKLPSEAELCEALSISRISLREAMRSMEALGMIEAKAGLGWFVRDFSLEPLAPRQCDNFLDEPLARSVGGVGLSRVEKLYRALFIVE